MVFQRRSNLHPLNVMIMAEPAQAEAKMIAAYKSGGYTHEGAANVLGVSESTFIRWVRKLNLWAKLDAFRRKAEKAGDVLPSRRPARKPA